MYIGHCHALGSGSGVLCTVIVGSMRHNVKPAPPVTVCNSVIDAEGSVDKYIISIRWCFKQYKNPNKFNRNPNTNGPRTSLQEIQKTRHPIDLGTSTSTRLEQFLTQTQIHTTTERERKPSRSIFALYVERQQHSSVT